VEILERMANDTVIFGPKMEFRMLMKDRPESLIIGNIHDSAIRNGGREISIASPRVVRIGGRKVKCRQWRRCRQNGFSEMDSLIQNRF
jgi:hypothetical protein